MAEAASTDKALDILIEAVMTAVDRRIEQSELRLAKQIANAKLGTNNIEARALKDIHFADGCINLKKMAGILSSDHIADNSLPMNKLQGTLPSSKIEGVMRYDCAQDSLTDLDRAQARSNLKLGNVVLCSIANNLTTSVADTVLDGRQGKELKMLVDAMKVKATTMASSLGFNNCVLGEPSTSHYTKQGGVCCVSLSGFAITTAGVAASITGLPLAKMRVEGALFDLSNSLNPTFFFMDGWSGTINFIPNGTKAGNSYGSFTYVMKDE